MLLYTKFVLLSNQQSCACNLTFAIYANKVIFNEFAQISCLAEFTPVILILIHPFLKLSRNRFNQKH